MAAIIHSHMLHLYNFFHLNLAYSAIEEADRAKVIERCYWPLLRLANDRNLPIGVELSGYTLEVIASIDPSWVAELKELVANGVCELIGCGYAQMIGPLAPAAVTEANLRIGNAVYKEHLDTQPSVALLNEQAYSAGLVPIYLGAGYESIIMEWNNPARGHPEWDKEWSYLPQRAVSPSGISIPLIWNQSINFQKVQRFAHGELELEEVLEFFRSHKADHDRTVPVYGNDIEIFDYRPGRYMTEASIQAEGEWIRINALYEALEDEPDMAFIHPSEVLALKALPGADNVLELESPALPIPVKKQDKYNVVRWAVSGRNDLDINTRCQRLYSALQTSGSATEADWKELCYLWSSDFRTHITQKRWDDYQIRLSAFYKTWIKAEKGASTPSRTHEAVATMDVRREGRMLDIKGSRISVRLNCYRGLAIDYFVDRQVAEAPLIGTLHHGHFDDILYGADYYSGHLVFESPGKHKITDLNPIEPTVSRMSDGVIVTGTVTTPLGLVEKTWRIDDRNGEVQLTYGLRWPESTIGSLRLGHVTLLTGGFDLTELELATHNGGREMETFRIAGNELDHGASVSAMISANHAISVSEGVVELGDTEKVLRLRIDRNDCAAIGLVKNHPVKDKNLTRFAFSIQEFDDTSKSRETCLNDIQLSIWMSAYSRDQVNAG